MLAGSESEGMKVGQTALRAARQEEQGEGGAPGTGAEAVPQPGHGPWRVEEECEEEAAAEGNCYGLTVTPLPSLLQDLGKGNLIFPKPSLFCL